MTEQLPMEIEDNRPPPEPSETECSRCWLPFNYKWHVKDDPEFDHKYLRGNQ